MIQEEKQLLLKDLSARVPYKVKLGFENSDLILVPEEFNVYTMQLSTNQIYPKVDRAVIKHIYDIWNYRPYLRSMSSMTEEEWIKFYKWANCRIENDSGEIGSKSRGFGEGYEYLGIDDMSDAIDWLNSHHFDYRGLIKKGLALEAPENMYKTK